MGQAKRAIAVVAGIGIAGFAAYRVGFFEWVKDSLGQKLPPPNPNDPIQVNGPIIDLMEPDPDESFTTFNSTYITGTVLPNPVTNSPVERVHIVIRPRLGVGKVLDTTVQPVNNVFTAYSPTLSNDEYFLYVSATAQDGKISIVQRYFSINYSPLNIPPTTPSTRFTPEEIAAEMAQSPQLTTLINQIRVMENISQLSYFALAYGVDPVSGNPNTPYNDKQLKILKQEALDRIASLGGVPKWP